MLLEAASWHGSKYSLFRFLYAPISRRKQLIDASDDGVALFEQKQRLADSGGKLGFVRQSTYPLKVI